MLRLARHRGRILEPACGDGAFTSQLGDFAERVAIEQDSRFCPGRRLGDGFSSLIPESEKFATVIGNPPYVRARDVCPSTRLQLLDAIARRPCQPLPAFHREVRSPSAPGGELVFITAT